MLGWLVSLLILALDIVAIYSILTSAMSNAKKVLWVFLVLILPVAGMILWFLLGKKR